MKQFYLKIAKLILPGMLLMLFMSVYVSAQTPDTLLPGCDTYGRIFYNPSDSLTCKYTIITDDGAVFNPVEFDPNVPIIDSMYVKFGYEFTDNYSCYGEPVIITCFEVVEQPETCVADFSYYQVDCDSLDTGIDCGGNVYHFVARDYPSIIAWKWTVNNEIVSYEPSFTYDFSSPGDYIVELETTSATNVEDSCTARKTEYFTIYPNNTDSCWVSFQYQRISNDTDTMYAYQFFPEYSDSVLSYYWTVDGEYVSASAGPTIYFDEPGTYNVCLVVETSAGCQASSCASVDVLAETDCEVNIVYYPIDSLSGIADSVEYHIYGVTQNTVTQWEWFLDGIYVSSGSSFNYFFNKTDFYPVSVRITTAEGCKASDYDTINVDTGQVSDCFASFSYYKVDYTDSLVPVPDTGNLYQFYAYVPNDVKSYYWTKDGYYAGNIANPVIEFFSGGYHDVCLTIETYSGCTVSYCDSIYISGVPECNADFYYYKIYDNDSTIYIRDTLTTSQIYQFIDISTGSIDYWSWDFGDGTQSNLKNPVHTFAQPGIYNVRLLVKSSDVFCYDTIVKQVIVGEPQNCHAYFEYCTYNLIPNDTLGADTIVPGENNLLIGFKNLSTGNGNYSTYWSFGDGTYSNQKNPVHQYNNSGIYEVCLQIYSVTGCKDTYCQIIKVGATNECEVDFTYNTLVPDCQGFNVAYVFEPETSGNDSAYFWSFGDGENSYTAAPIHVYEHYGTYEVCLEVLSDDGCVAKKCKTISFTQDLIDSAYVYHCKATPVRKLEYEQSLAVQEIYPMPASQTLTIIVESETAQQAQIDLVDILGKHYKITSNQWLSAGKNQLNVDLDGFKTGNYVYFITGDKGVARGNIIIVE
jgi:PKD repeat protein